MLPSNAGSLGLIPGWGNKIPYALKLKNQDIKQKQYCNKFNKDFKKNKGLLARTEGASRTISSALSSGGRASEGKDPK